MITVNKITREFSERFNNWKLVAEYSNGSDTCFGHAMTEAGSKRMLTVRAKQFGLKVNGNVAIKA